MAKVNMGVNPRSKKYVERSTIRIIGTIAIFLTLQKAQTVTAKSSSLGSFTSFLKPLLIGGKRSKRFRTETTSGSSSSTAGSIRSSTTYRMSSVRGGKGSPLPSDQIQIQSNATEVLLANMQNNSTCTTRVASSDIPMNFAFSDVDGTLVHYPPLDTNNRGHSNSKADGEILYLPPSSTGMRGIISSKTLQICQVLRREQNVKFVLVSGMRTSTLLKRLPYLPRADAYASEAGGRIFYPVTTTADLKNYNGKLVEPVCFDGASSDDLQPFGLVEDMAWRKELSRDDAAGTDGYIGDVMNEFLSTPSEGRGLEELKPIKEREGALWNFAKVLESEGFILDYKGYSCCFRVNWKHQNKETISEEDFKRLSLRDVSKLGLATSVNLGCIDFYPFKSGKKNCCAYLARKFLSSEDSIHGEIIGDDILLQRATCFCDDDNDLEMASACGRVFLPSISSQTMADAAREDPEKIIITEDRDKNIVETVATENALLRALEMYRKMSQLRP